MEASFPRVSTCRIFGDEIYKLNETYQGWDFDQTCAHVAQTGYEGIEVAPFTLKGDPRDLTVDDAQRCREIASRAGLEILGLHCYWLSLRQAPYHSGRPLRKDTAKFAKNSRNLRCYGRKHNGLGQSFSEEHRV